MNPSEISNQATILVIGVGNELRGDDAVGLLVARKLGSLKLLGARVMEFTGDGAELMDSWTGFNSVFVVDAITIAEPAGTVHRFEAHRQPLPPNLFRLSTHSLGLPEAIELSRHLSRMPRELIVYGIASDSFDIGQSVSPTVAASIQAVSETLIVEIQKRLPTKV